MTESSIDLSAFDLANATDLAVLSDALADAGRTAEVDLCRRPKAILIVRDGVIEDACDAAEEIRDELARLGLDGSPESPSVYADDDLPAGWLRIDDGTGRVVADGRELLAAIQEVEESEDVFDDFWNALDYPDRCTAGWRDLDGLVDSASGEEGGAVVRLRCNGGWRYTATNDGLNTDAVSEAFRYDAWSDDVEHAIDSWGDGCVGIEDVPVRWRIA